jgi:hypothetical protein
MSHQSSLALISGRTGIAKSEEEEEEDICLNK